MNWNMVTLPPIQSSKKNWIIFQDNITGKNKPFILFPSKKASNSDFSLFEKSVKTLYRLGSRNCVYHPRFCNVWVTQKNTWSDKLINKSNTCAWMKFKHHIVNDIRIFVLILKYNSSLLDISQKTLQYFPNFTNQKII